MFSHTPWRALLTREVKQRKGVLKQHALMSLKTHNVCYETQRIFECGIFGRQNPLSTCQIRLLAFAGGGGGGFYSSGRSSTYYGGTMGKGGEGGKGFRQGGDGGRGQTNNAFGGFGGGGGAYGSGGGGGGGGGYSGGGSGKGVAESCGGGGGSYNAGKNQTNECCFNTDGHGWLIITLT